MGPTYHSPMTDRIRLAVLLLGEFGLLVGLHALARLDGFTIDWSDPGGWLADSPFEDVAGAVILLIALVLAYWLLISTVAYLLATASGRPGLIRSVHWLTLPPIRRMASRAVALTLAASAVAGPIVPAVAYLAGSERVIVTIGPEGQLVPPGTTPTGEEVDEDRDIVLPPHLGPASHPGAAPGGTPTVVDELLDGTIAKTVVVRRGDHMWSLSEAHLERVTGRTDLGEHEIARYWVRVMAENRTRIRSGDPDLIYPGETLVLPPV